MKDLAHKRYSTSVYFSSTLLKDAVKTESIIKLVFLIEV